MVQYRHSDFSCGLCHSGDIGLAIVFGHLNYHIRPNSASPLLLGPVVQSIVSLTSSLRVISLTLLADSIYNMLIFFAEKM